MKNIFKMTRNKRNSNSGYTLLETVVYVGILSVLLLAIFSVLFSVTRAFVEARVYNEVEISGMTVMERITREIRIASATTTAGTILDSHPGQLELKTTAVDGSLKAIQFYYDSANMTVNVIESDTADIADGTDKGPLTGKGVEITNLIFREWPTPKGSLIKVELTVRSKKKATLSANYYDSVVLRGAY